jgi:hypothetical protein
LPIVASSKITAMTCSQLATEMMRKETYTVLMNETREKSGKWLVCLPLDPKVAGSNLAKAMDF